MAKEPRTLSIVSSPLGERFSYKANANTTSRHRQDNNPRPQGFGAAKQLQSHLLSPVSSPPPARHSQLGWLVFQKEAWCSRRGVCSLSNITHCVASEYHTLYGWRHSSSETPFISRENSHPPFGGGGGSLLVLLRLALFAGVLLPLWMLAQCPECPPSSNSTLLASAPFPVACFPLCLQTRSGLDYL